MAFIEVAHEAEPTYPGYSFRQSTDGERILVDKDERQLIEVYSTRYTVGIGEQRRFKYDIVAVLEGVDAPIYHLLQWRNYWRGHPASSLALQAQLTMIWGVLIIVHILAALTGVFGHPVLALLAIVLGPPVEIAVGSLLWRIGRLCWGVTEVFFEAAWNILFHGKSWKHYHDLFVALSRAADKDKASAARVMSRIFF
jgi:hypothetical protein